jgi:hypothetical protein
MTCDEITIIEENCEIVISSVGAQGAKGDTGATGAQGPAGDISNITSTDGSIIITTPIAGTRDLSVVGGSAITLLAQVRNQTGATLTKGTLVYISGASGNKCLVSKAQANSESTSSKTFGMIQNDILTNQNGYVVISGIVEGLNTEAYPDGTTLYLSPSIAGDYTSTKPSAPNHLVYIGVVTRSHQNQGAIQTRIQNGYELDEIHDVAISNPQNNQILSFNSTTNLWNNTSISNTLGFMPINNNQSIVNALIFG